MLHAVARPGELDEPTMLDKPVHDGGGHLVVAEWIGNSYLDTFFRD